MRKIIFFLSLFLMIVSLGFCKDENDSANGIASSGVQYVYAEEDPNLLVAQIEENGLKTIYCYNSSKQCVALFREYEEKIILRCFYFYDAQGFLERATTDDGQGVDAEDLTGVTYQEIIRLYMENQPPFLGKPLKIENVILDFQSLNEEMICEMFFNYDEKGELISINDRDGEVVVKAEKSIDDLFQNKEDHFLSSCTETIPLNQIWDRAVNSFYACCQFLQRSAHQAKIKWNAELQIPAPVAQVMEKIAKTLVGGPTYLLMGPHFEETRIDSYGEREISDKVRVTFINGILNTHVLLEESLQAISESHGGVNVHHVFRPTEGWTWDISRAIAIRTAFTLGFRSLHAHLLAELWRELIQEMGGVDGGGVIIHYAHSLGGSDTDRARGLLTPEEQQMIRVTTFGSSTMVRNEGYRSVINIISVNDGVSSCLLEPLGHIRNYFDPNTNILFYGSLHTPPYFPTDHMLNGFTYDSVLREMGRKFLKEFLSQDDSTISL